MTGRLRIEQSSYFKTKADERAFFESEEDDLIQKVVRHLRKHAADHIREVPFKAVWDAFWGAIGSHIFVKESHKAAVVYAYNEETR